MASQKRENNNHWKGGVSLNKSEHTKMMRAKYPEKYKARQLVTTALKKGTLIRQPCEKCSNPKSQAHHAEYSKPLEVTWVCSRCHAEIHRSEALVRASAEAKVRPQAELEPLTHFFDLYPSC